MHRLRNRTLAEVVLELDPRVEEDGAVNMRQGETLLVGTPYLIDGEAGEARFRSVSSKARDTRKRAREAAGRIAEEAQSTLGPFQSAMRSDLVSESNRLEGYAWSSREILDVVNLHHELLDFEYANFIRHIKDDRRLVESLGLYRAYEIADDWAHSEDRPREFELRSLHSMILGANRGSGHYKSFDVAISGSAHVPIPHLDAPIAMAELASWFERGSGDPLLDAVVVHAWLTHIHPFEDGNGRMARLLANLALVQEGFPSLLLRSTADREPYLEALAASDDGDIMPLYDLFERSLRRAVLAMEKPNFVQLKIRGELFRSTENRYRMWRQALDNLVTSLQHKVRPLGWKVTVMGFPSQEDFVALEERRADGNCWFLKFEDPEGHQPWLLFFGYRSDKLFDLSGGSSTQRCWPSIFCSRPSSDPRSVHRWEPVYENDDPDMPEEICVSPATTRPVTVRRELTTRDHDMTDGCNEIVRAFCR